MPFQPAMGPGTWYNILVHPKYAEKANAILIGLPIDLSTDPDMWHFGANKRIKKVWKILIWISLAIGFLFLILGLIQNIV